MYLYRAIFNLYLGKYTESLEDLTKSWKQHFAANQQAKKDACAGTKKVGIDTENEEMFGKFPVSHLVSPINSVLSYNSTKTDLSEVGLCSLNISEYQLNSMILFIQMNNWQEALKKCNELLATAPPSNENFKSLK
jgi:hypothetical protein